MLNQTEFIGTPFNESLQIVLVAIGIAVLLSGILGNGLLLVVMWRSRREVRGVSNIFIANLALADLVVVCCSVPFFVVDLLWNRHPVAGSLHCQLNGFVMSVGYSASVLSMTLISFNRYAKVCHSNVFHRLFSPRRNKVFCLLLWGTGIVLNLPFFLPAVPSYGYDPRVHICNARADRTYADYGSVAMIIMLVIPVFLIGYFNAAIFRRWRDTRRKVQRHKGKERREFKVKGRRSASVSVKRLTSERKNTTMEESTEVNTDVGHVIELVAGKVNDADMTSSKDSVTAVLNDIESKDDQPGLTVSDLNKLGSQAHDEVSEQLRKSNKNVISSPFRSHPLVLNTKPDTRVKTPVTSTSSASVRRPDQDLCTGGVNLCCASDFDNTGSSAEAATRSPGTKEDTTDADDPRAADRDRKMHPYAEKTRSDECSGSSRRPTNKKSVQNVQTQQRSAATACNARKQTASEVALVRSLLVIFICFFVLYTPFAVNLILTVFLKDSVPPELPVISVLCLFVNCAINWIIYGVMNTVFRHAYVTTLKNLCSYCCGTSTTCHVSSRRNIYRLQ